MSKDMSVKKKKIIKDTFINDTVNDDLQISGGNIDEAMPLAVAESDADKVTFVTKDGLKKLKDELEYLKEVRRKEVSERLKEAISFGDLSENSEYEEAKNEQAFVEGRIIELEEKIKHAKIISDKHSSKVVNLGSKVKIRNLKDGADEEFTVVGTTESDPLNHLISNESPIGSALIDKRVGEEIKVQVPAGTVRYKVMSVK